MIIRSSSFKQKDKCCLHRLYMSHQQSVLDFQYYTSHLLSVAECGPNALSGVYFVVSVSFFYSFPLFVYVPCFHTPQAHSVSVTAEISCQFRNRCSFIMKTGGRVIRTIWLIHAACSALLLIQSWPLQLPPHYNTHHSKEMLLKLH